MDPRTKQKYIIFLSGTLGVLLILWAGLWYFQRPGFKKYVDKRAGFSLRYPGDWAYSPNKDGANVIFYSPIESDYDMFAENVNIVVQDISSKPLNIQQYTELAIRQMKAVFGEQMDVLESVPTDLGGQQGHRFVIQGKSGPQPRWMMMVWTVKDEKAYQFTYTAQPDTHQYYMEDVEKMKKSFRIRG